MEFPIIDLLEEERSIQWLTEYFHANGFGCPKCGAPVAEARPFRETKRSRLTVYRCRRCDTPYNLYTGTVFQQHHLTPRQAVRLVRGVCKGEPSTVLAAELGLNYQTVLELRHELQANPERAQPDTPLPDAQTETDEMFQNAGEKGEPHRDPLDAPRRRANRRRGLGTYDNNRPPIVGTVGRETGQVRLRVVKNTTAKVLEEHVHRFTLAGSHLYTDENQSYNHVIRPRWTVCHSQHEWAREDDDDGIRGVHVNTAEGMWTDTRNFLRPFKGVHKKYLSV